MSDAGLPMFERRRQAIAAGLLMVAIATALAVPVALDGNAWPLQTVDERWQRWMVDVRTPWLTSFAQALDVVGGPYVIVPIRIGVAAVLSWRRRWMALTAFITATITSELCIGPLKALFDRPRPLGGLLATETMSFPSGHAIAASVTAIGLVIVLVPSTGRRRGWTALAATFAMAMAMSRTYLGAHWLSDAVAGGCIGTGVAVVSSAVLELRPRVESWGEVLRLASITLVSLGIACVVVLHLLRPELSPTADRISEYAHGQYGALMTTSFVLIGLGLLAMTVPLHEVSVGWRRAVAAAVACAGVGMVVSGLFRTDPVLSGAAADAIHSLASASATVALIGAALVWSAIAPVRRRWSDAGAPLAMLAAVLGVASVALHRSAWSGLGQRLLWLALLAWIIVAAARSLTPMTAANSAARQRPPAPSGHEHHPSQQGHLARPRGRRRPRRRLLRRTATQSR